MARAREIDKAKDREYLRAWRAKNADRIRAQKRERWKGEMGELTKEARRKKYRENPEANIARSDAWRKANPEKFKAQRKAWLAKNKGRTWRYNLKSHYGLTSEEIDRMLIEQAGRCAACRDPMTDPHVDHCHRTKRVRAMLCSPCNLALGYVKDDPRRLRLLISYLKQKGGNLAAMTKEESPHGSAKAAKQTH